MPLSPPPPALAVLLVINRTEPYVELTFNNSRNSKAHRHTKTFIIGANLDSIRLDLSSYFGIRFLTGEDAQSWYDAVEAPWHNLFSRESSTSQTVWIRRGFSTDDLMRMPNSWWNEVMDKNHDEGDDRGKSHGSPAAALADGLSKMAKKAAGKRERRNRRLGE